MYSDWLFIMREVWVFVVLSYWPALCFLMLLAPCWGPAGLRSRRGGLFWHLLLCPTSDFPSPFSLSLINFLWHILTLCSISCEISPATHTQTQKHLPKSAAISLTVFCRQKSHTSISRHMRMFVFASSCAILYLVPSTSGKCACMCVSVSIDLLIH